MYWANEHDDDCFVRLFIAGSDRECKHIHTQTEKQNNDDDIINKMRCPRTGWCWWCGQLACSKVHGRADVVSAWSKSAIFDAFSEPRYGHALTARISTRLLTTEPQYTRIDHNADASQAIFEPPPQNWRRPPGRPRTTWVKNIHDNHAGGAVQIPQLQLKDTALKTYLTKITWNEQIWPTSLSVGETICVAFERSNSPTTSPLKLIRMLKVFLQKNRHHNQLIMLT